MESSQPNPEQISLCIVAKDSLKNIEQLVTNVHSIVSEIIIVDTGSDAETVAYEQGVATQLIQAPWQGDFAAMRNLAISKSTKPWILALDTDETLSDKLVATIPTLVGNPNVEGYRFHRIHYIDEASPLPDYWKHLRLYRRHAHYMGAIHESIKNLNQLVEIPEDQGVIEHHNARAHQREKALKYAEYLHQALSDARKNNDRDFIDYYEYKLWTQEEVYLLETDPNVAVSKLYEQYAAYENRKRKFEIDHPGLMQRLADRADKAA